MSNELGFCKYCGKEVMWVNTKNGKRLPLNMPSERMYVLDSGVQPMVAQQRNVYSCHLDTCAKNPGLSE